MSRDVQIAWPCPHLTVEEVVSLETDRRSLATRQPVGGAGTVRILVNDELFIPATGWSSPATLFSTLSGPFDLRENEDTVTVVTSGGTFTLALGVTGQVRWGADIIVQKFLGSDFSIGLIENVNGHLLITDTNTVGVGSLVKVTGTAAAALGFGQDGVSARQRQARGQKVYPGWSLGVRSDTITNRRPVFNEVVRGNPVFKVTYSVPVNRCLRCGATFVENDYRFDTTGNAILIDEEDLLYQACLKILLTDRGSNPYHTWYGTVIRSRIGSKALGGTAALLSDDVRRALTRLQSVQKEQANYQVVTPKERLYNLLNIQVSPHEQDPTTFLVDVVVQNASAEPISLSIVFTVPGVVAVMGSNGLFLGTQAAGLTSGRASSLFLSDGS